MYRIRHGGVPALLALLVLLVGCAGLGIYPDPPRVSLANLQPVEMGLFEQRYRLWLRIQNPNAVDIPVAGLDYTLYINDKEFAYGVSRQDVTVPAFGEALIEVDVVSSLMSVITQIQQLNERQNESLSYRLTGGLSLGNHPGKLPFEYKGKIATPQSPPPGSTRLESPRVARA
jgi:LEA14-like dessication related protein